MPKSKIDWTDYTWNPVSGCTKVSEGCKFCYADRFSKRTLKPFDQPGRKFTDIVFHEEMFNKLNTFPDGSKIFVGSVTDIFHPDIPDSFLEKLWNTFLAYSGLPIVSKLKLKKFTFQILTKRPERMMEFCNKFAPLPNVWLGVSAENQQRYDERVPFLLRTRAAVRFLSLEPLLDEIKLKGLNFSELEKIEWMKRYVTAPAKIDWVIIGGESGQQARKCNLLWIEELVFQTQLMEISTFVKQLGSNPIYNDKKFYFNYYKLNNGKTVRFKKNNKGNDFEQFPESIKIREFPNVKS